MGRVDGFETLGRVTEARIRGWSEPTLHLRAWRMAVAKYLLRRQDCALAEVAERVGYGSASTFSAASSRHVGQPPGRYARECYSVA